MSDQRERWLTIDEAAALIRVPKSWLYERTRTNTVPHVKLGKYLRFDQEEFLTWARRFRRDGRGRPVHAGAPKIPGARARQAAVGLKAHRS
jgi:excisionase family DNA binding protein